LRDEFFWKGYGMREGIKFLYVGRVSREKNLELLADAFKEIVKLGLPVQLAIIGDGPYRKDLEKKLDGYPATFTGFLEGEELAKGYASADVFVFPSTTDTFGNVVLEAQASGLPVIVSDEGGPKELIKEGNTGFIVKAGDKDDLFNAMLFFLQDEKLMHAMGQNARIFTEQ
jgi:glycosyltransferase involved in cell wall biosynthesis